MPINTLYHTWFQRIRELRPQQCIPQVRGHSTARKQIALLASIRQLLSRGAGVFVVGDSEFGSVEVLQ